MPSGFFIFLKGGGARVSSSYLNPSPNVLLTARPAKHMDKTDAAAPESHC